MNNPFLKRLMKEEKKDVMHSSAYGQAQNVGGMGVASTESFEKRRKIDMGRTQVRRYGESKVAHQTAEEVLRERRQDVTGVETGGGDGSSTGGAAGGGTQSEIAKGGGFSAWENKWDDGARQGRANQGEGISRRSASGQSIRLEGGEGRRPRNEGRVMPGVRGGAKPASTPIRRNPGIFR